MKCMNDHLDMNKRITAHRTLHGANRPRMGFTLMEMLIVIAIIAVLVAIAIPALSGQLERAKIATDEANARSGYALVATELLNNPSGSGSTTYVYDLKNSKVIEGTATGVEGYGKASTAADYEISGIPVSGTPENNYVSYGVKNGQIVSISWGTAYGSLWHSISGKTIEGDNWYGTYGTALENKKAAYNTVRSISDAERVAADTDSLNSFASYFSSLSVDEARAILGNQYDRMKGSGGAVLMSYCVDGAYSIRLNPDKATNNTDYLSNMGYSPRIYVTEGGTSTWHVSDDYSKVGNSYVDTFLLASDAAIAELGRDRQVKMSFKEVDGQITDVKVWVAGTDLSSNLAG